MSIESVDIQNNIINQSIQNKLNSESETELETELEQELSKYNIYERIQILIYLNFNSL